VKNPKKLIKEKKKMKKNPNKIEKNTLATKILTIKNKKKNYKFMRL